MRESKKEYIEDMWELREIQLDILDAFVQFCDKNKLVYYLTGGTLLGAVRHKGFIPWDDDVDIVMPRPDYERLRILSEGQISQRYKVEYYTPKGRHCRLYYRVVDTSIGYQDVYFDKKYESCMGIDVFPIDGVPENLVTRERYFGKIKRLRKLFMLSVSAPWKGTTTAKAILKTIRMIPTKMRGSNCYYKKIMRLAEQYRYEESDEVALAIGYYNRKEVLKKEQYGVGVLLEFEGRQYRAPADYKGYLKNLYGEYEKLPPKEERVTHHSFHAWRK